VRTNTRPIIALILAAAAVLAAAPASAEPRWVADQLTISFREGPGNQYAIQRFLSTGRRLEVLDTPAEAADKFGASALEEWTYVRDAEAGDEGWVQGQYLMDERPARIRIGEVEQQLADARERIETLEEQLAERESEKAELQGQLSDARARVETLESELEQAQEGYELVEANEALKERVNRLLERNEQLEARRQEVAEQRQQQWFLAGAGVLVGGVLLGLILPRLRPPRRNRWGSEL